MRARQILFAAVALAILGPALWFVAVRDGSTGAGTGGGPGADGAVDAVADGPGDAEAADRAHLAAGRRGEVPEVFAAPLPELEPLAEDASREVTVRLRFGTSARPDGPVRAIALRRARSGASLLSALQSTSDGTEAPADARSIFQDLVTEGPSRAELRGEILASAPLSPDGSGAWSGALRLPIREQRYFVYAFGGGFWSPRPSPADPWSGEVTVHAVQGARLQVEVRSPSGERLDPGQGAVTVATDPPATDAASRGNDPPPRVSIRMQLDADGRAVAAIVPAGQPLRVRLAHPEGSADPRELDGIAPGERTSLRLDVGVGVPAVGRVVDEDGDAVPGATVRVSLPGEGFGLDDRLVREVLSGQDGTFEVRGLRQTTHAFLALMAGRLQSRRVQVPVDAGTEPIELVLEAGGTISGTAFTPAGEPAAGARVRASYDVGFLMSQGAISAFRGGTAETVVGPDGTFVLTGLGAGPFSITLTLEAAGAGELMDRVDGVTTGTSELELVARPGRTVGGRVVDETGAPLGDVPVTGLRLAGELIQLRAFEVRTAPDGRFLAEGLAPGRLRLSVRTDRFATVEAVEVDLGTDGGVQDLELRAPRTVRVTGRVTGPDGQPVEGARVEAVVTSTNAALAMFEGATVPPARTDRRGEYTLVGVPAMETVPVRASRTGFARATHTLEGPAPGSLASAVDLALGRGGALEGICFEADGTTSSNRTVIVQSMDMERRVVQDCEPDGTFRIEGLEPGLYQVVSMSPEAMAAASDGGDANRGALFAGMRLARAEIVDGKTATVFLGDPGHQLVRAEGRVLRGGEPVPGATVAWVGTDREVNEALRSTTADQEEGRYALELPALGAYFVQVTVFDAAAPGGRAVEFAAVLGEDDAGEDRAFDLAGGRIAGHVRRPDGSPAIGARVTLTDAGELRMDRMNGQAYAEVIASGDGAFEFFDLPPGRYQIAAGGTSMGNAAFDAVGREVVGQFEVGEGQEIEGLEVVAAPTGALSVRVTAPDGTPLADAGVFLRDALGRHTEFVSLLFTDDDGRCLCGTVAPGRYTVCARSASLATQESDPVEVRAGETATLELVAVPASRLIVQVNRARGQPGMGVTLTVTDEAGRDVTGRIGARDTENLYGKDSLSFDERRFGPLPPGRYRVTARGPAGGVASTAVRITGNREVRRVTLNLE